MIRTGDCDHYHYDLTTGFQVVWIPKLQRSKKSCFLWLRLEKVCCPKSTILGASSLKLKTWKFLSCFFVCGVLPENLSWLKGAEVEIPSLKVFKKNSFHLTRKSLGKWFPRQPLPFRKGFSCWRSTQLQQVSFKTGTPPSPIPSEDSVGRNPSGQGPMIRLHLQLLPMTRVLQRKKSTVPEWNCQPWSPLKVPAEKCRFSSDFVVSSSHAVTLAILIQLMYIIFLCTYTCGFESWRQNLVRVKNHELHCTLRSISNLRPFRSSNPRSKALATGSVKVFWHVSIPMKLRNGTWSFNAETPGSKFGVVRKIQSLSLD